MQNKFYLLGYIALFFLSGCAAFTSIPAHQNDTQHNKKTQQVKGVKDRDIAPHVLSIDPDGKLNLIGCNEEDGDKPEWCESQQSYIDNIVTNINKEGKDLLIYVHGGLNKEKDALERAKKKYDLILNDKENPRYPIFVNWRSGPFTTYWDHVWRIRQGEKDKHSLTKLLTVPVYLFTDFANSLVNAPKAWTVTGKHMLVSTSHATDKNDILNDIKKLDDANVTNIHYNGDKQTSKFFRNIRWLVTSPSKVVTTPFTYTLAKPAWDIMLRRTSTLFYTPEDLTFHKQPDNQDPAKQKEVNNIRTIPISLARVPLKSGNGALFRFLSALEKDNYTSNIDITLIGHSMGAIVINNIVNLGLNLTYKNIVHMASADSIDNLFNKVVPYIDCSLKRTCNTNNKTKGKNEVNFYSLYLHPDNENREVSAGGLTPSGSLLTWIDNMYTIPKTVLDKRSGRWDNMKRAIELIPSKIVDNKKPNNVRGQMHFTIFGLEERKPYKENILMNAGINLNAFKPIGYENSKKRHKLYSTAQEHGDFGDLPFWREEIWKGEPLSGQ